MNANEILTTAGDLLSDRASQRDSDSERSMSKCIETFNAEHGTFLSEQQGWDFMIHLKKARSKKGYCKDDWLDMVAYTSLQAECALNNPETSKKNVSLLEALTALAKGHTIKNEKWEILISPTNHVDYSVSFDALSETGWDIL